MMNRIAQALMMMPIAYENPYYNKPNKMVNSLYGLQGIDIEKEYELIQRKKSKLSSQKRDQIVAYVNRMRKEQR